MSIICSNTVLSFSFLFENFEWIWNLFKRLIENFSIWEGKELFCTMPLSQMPSRGSDPPSEAKCFRHTSLKTLCSVGFICQIGNTAVPLKREKINIIPFYVLRIVSQCASVRLIIFILGNCLHLKADVFQDWIMELQNLVRGVSYDKGRGITVTVNSKLYGNMSLIYRIVWLWLVLVWNSALLSRSSFWNSWQK